MKEAKGARKKQREIETDETLATFGLFKFDKEDPETYMLARDVVFGVAAIRNTPMIQHIVDSIFGEGKFTIAGHTAQAFDRETPSGKGVALDVLALDGQGRQFDLEIQIAKETDLPRRAREYQAHIDSAQLRPGSTAQELKDCYVIFITAYDPFGAGLHLYEEEFVLKGTGIRVEHGFHFVYVNAFHPDIGSPLGRMCKDLFCQNEAEIHSALLKEALQYCRGKKGKEEIRMRMNQTEFEVRQRVTKEVTAENQEAFIRSLLEEGGYSDERIARLVRIPLEEAIRIRKKIESEGN